MIYGRKSGEGHDVIIIGLSRRNVEKLLEGKPIFKRASTLEPGLPELVLFVEATEDACLAKLKEIGLYVEGKTELVRHDQ